MNAMTALYGNTSGGFTTQITMMKTAKSSDWMIRHYGHLLISQMSWASAQGSVMISDVLVVISSGHVRSLFEPGKKSRN